LHNSERPFITGHKVKKSRPECFYQGQDSRGLSPKGWPVVCGGISGMVRHTPGEEEDAGIPFNMARRSTPQAFIIATR
jgi:hypothetical protein